MCRSFLETGDEFREEPVFSLAGVAQFLREERVRGNRRVVVAPGLSESERRTIDDLLRRRA